MEKLKSDVDSEGLSFQDYANAVLSLYMGQTGDLLSDIANFIHSGGYK